MKRDNRKPNHHSPLFHTHEELVGVSLSCVPKDGDIHRWWFLHYDQMKREEEEERLVQLFGMIFFFSFANWTRRNRNLIEYSSCLYASVVVHFYQLFIYFSPSFCSESLEKGVTLLIQLESDQESIFWLNFQRIDI